ncbi:hypothetical protein NT239_15645 [Chitinibacter sp. SCUT-21]|uniref:protein YgfX n=1 Tax=Chitinibacter sp. SCUT-21 TaxID=2970891 RepID=UPI0035A65EC7
MLPAILKLNPVSRWQRGFLLSMHLLAGVNAWWMSWPMALALDGVLVLSLFWQWRRENLVSSIQCLPDGVMQVQLSEGTSHLMELQPSSVLTAQVLVLHLKGENKRINFVVWPDSADAEVLRQWRIYLRWMWPNAVRRAKIPL